MASRYFTQFAKIHSHKMHFVDITWVTLLALIAPILSGVIYCDMALYVCLREFDREHLKTNAALNVRLVQ